MVKIIIINGDAGTGKTHKLSNFINIVINKNKSFVALSYTHSAINNLYKTYTNMFNDSLLNREQFQTLHKFFRIDIKTGKINSSTIKHYNYMFIDEYSLISVQLFESIKTAIENNIDKLVLCGDYKQLKTIDAKTEISYENLEKYMNIINEQNNINKNIIEAIRHYDNSILSLSFIHKNISDIVVLKKCLRSNDNVKNTITKLCFSDNIDESFLKSKLCCLSTVIDLIVRHGYIFIASRYKYLQNIHDKVNQGLKTTNIYQTDLLTEYGLNCLHLTENQQIIITENFTECDELFTNGDTFKFIEYNNKNKVITLFNEETNEYHFIHPLVKNVFNKTVKLPNDYNLNKLGQIEYNNEILYAYFPIVPSNLITYHKSQGKTYKNVILCIDSLFDFAMLYTGLSRAAENVLLFSFNDNDKTELNNINSIYTYLNTLIKIDLFDKANTKIRE